jgi:hypothetical protein
VSNDYDEAYANAKHKPAFSNGSEGYAWMGNWCDQCSKNDEATELWCPLLSVALLGRTPVEWIEQPWGQVAGRPEGQTAPRLGDTYHCTAFSPRDDGDDDGESSPEPDPLPTFAAEMPGQVDIFSLFADDIAEQAEQTTRVPA